MSLALAGEFLTTVPPGKSHAWSLKRWTAREVPNLFLNVVLDYGS